jgi:hypothetical protein
MTLSTLFLTLIILLSTGVSDSLTAGEIYKWVDENGQTHFGTQPPADKKKKVVGESAQQPLAGSRDPAKTTSPTEQLLIGHWQGSRLGHEVDIVFASNGTFIESVLHKRPGYTGVHRRSYGGYWSVNERRIRFKPSYKDQGAQFIPEMSSASFISYQDGALTLVWDNDPEILRRQFQKSMPAFPEELR